MVNPLPVELEDGVADLHAVAQILALGLATCLDGPDLGPAGVRPEGRNAQSSAPNAKIVFYRSRGNESRYLSFNARSELLNSSGERASARRSILPVGIFTDPPSPPVLTVVVCLLKMVARYRPGSFGWMQMHRQQIQGSIGKQQPQYGPTTSGSEAMRGSPRVTHVLGAS